MKTKPLSPSKIKTLKQLSHHLEAVILLGAKGLTDAVHKEIDCALDSHELIKIKLSSKDKAEKQLLATTICEKNKATLIDQIGHVITIYRPSPKKPS
ncbi:MAG: YhbY family RNA-binding protein [Gammaproteobacteria bacterium]|nr:YhbY family RNA-binding protein [Gammaproteobacteria bacterium]